MLSVIGATGVTAGALETAIEDEVSSAGGARLAGIYRGRGYVPLWVEAGRAGERSAAILDRLRRADEDGLEPSDYGATAIAARMAARDAAGLAALDVLLTRHVLSYGHDVGRGRLTPEIAVGAAVSRPDPFDPDAFIARLAGAPDLRGALAALAPGGPRYRRLKSALAAYRAIAARGGWAAVPPGPSLERGAAGPRVTALRRRLALTGDLAPSKGGAADDSFDDAVDRAVRRFQDRHGLQVDGIAGRKTLAALNLPAAERIRQIAINLERRRWLGPDLGRRYVFVNIADAEVKYVEERNGRERTLIDMRAVVGRPYRKTPVFSAVITGVTVNPSWYVPASIARADIVPKVAADPSYLAREGIQVLTGGGPDARIVDAATIDWKAAAGRRFSYLLRQTPGPSNALGRIKVNMPNRFDVYLHDTPAQDLMAHATRAFSSGCIRLEKPAALVALLLHGSRWTRAEIDAAIASGRTSVIPLAAPVPVHVVYLTAWANKDGSVHFRRDIYDRDRGLARKLARSD